MRRHNSFEKCQDYSEQFKTSSSLKRDFADLINNPLGYSTIFDDDQDLRELHITNASKDKILFLINLTLEIIIVFGSK